MSELKDLQYRAMQIANHYDELNRASGRKGWNAQDYMDGMIGDVGDLMKAMMAIHGRRDMEDAEGKIEHELNDVLWSLLMLYYLFRIDPDKSFMKAMDELDMRVVNMKAELKKQKT